MIKKLQPLEASIFITLPEKVQSDLMASGVLPVNDVYMPMWQNEYKINLVYGSYGSGKSIYLVDECIEKVLNDPYRRIYFGRKIKDRVRESTFQTIIDRIKELNLEVYFDFSERPNGTMIIQCRNNGNKFIPFGSDNASSLKSIKDPTDFLCDELDQFSFEDFGFLYSRLRTLKADTCFYGAFNTERIYQSHWIRKVLFDGEFAAQAYRLKANYDDNFFIDQSDYLEKLKLIANGNAATLAAIARGEWGIIRTGDEFWKAFDETEHVRPVLLDKSSTIHVSLDENVNPYVTQTIWQIFPYVKKIKQVHEILSRSPHNNAPKAAQQFVDYLRRIEYNDVVYVYGDPSGGKRSTVDENSSSFFDKYIEVLQRNKFRVVKRVGRSAPEVALSATFINAIYEHNEAGWSIEIGDHCFSSIEDYIIVKEDADGKMMKPKITDKETKISYEPAGHISDTKRYFIIQVLPNEWQHYKRGKSSLKAQAGYFR